MEKQISNFLICCLFCLAGLQRLAIGQTVEERLTELMSEYESLGLSVAVVKDNQLVYTHSFGWKDEVLKIPLEESDIFRIASISKSFSATSIMQLIEAGKLSLDDDFSDLIGFKLRNPKFPNVPITLRMLMSHTSSLNDSLGYFNLDVVDPARNPDWARCYNNYEPGTGYQYCNLNYNLIGTVIERISGERFDQYVAKNVLKPLQLYAGYCVDSLDADRFVTLYEYDREHKRFSASADAYAPRREEINNYEMGRSTPIFSPTGGMKISAADLARYMMMHMNYGQYAGGRIMSEQSAKLMQTPVLPEEHYGLALMVTDRFIPGLRLVGHTGSAYGLYSSMFFNPEEKYGFVVITNGCRPDYKEGFNELLKNSAQVLYEAFVDSRN